MSIWTVVTVVIFVALIAFLMIGARKRDQSIAAWASKNNFTTLGKTLPSGLDLSTTDLAQAADFWNVYEGNVRGTRVVTFDCRVGDGSKSWRRTVVAADTPNASFGGVSLKAKTTVSRCGNWQVLYIPKSTAPAALDTVALLSATDLDSVLQSVS